MDEGRPVYASRFLRARIFNPDRAVLFVTFDHWQRGKAGFSDRDASESVAKAGFAELAVQTARNDWYLNGELPALRGALAGASGGYEAVRCFAFSMGAYAALLLSRDLHLNVAVLISPQWSIFPAQDPGDRRYRREAAGLDAGLGDLRGRIEGGLRGVILYDPVTQPIDAAHARLIAAEGRGLAKVPCAFGGHPASSHLRDGGFYKALQRLAYSGVADPAAYRALHVQARRTSTLYQSRRADFLERRAQSGEGEVTGVDQGG